jgi:hypothetical protein
MSGDRSEGLLVRAQPLEQAEHISRLMVDVRVADGVLLLDVDLLPRIVENRLDKRNFRTHQYGLERAQANS